MAADLRPWIEDELVAAGLDPERARSAAAATGSRVAPAATAVTVARVVRDLPEGASWWSSDDARVARAVAALVAGAPDDAEVLLAERLATPAPDVWDPNWPDHKVLWAVDVPDGLGVGDTFRIGDGAGTRALVEVVATDDGLGAAIVDGSRSHGLAPWADAVYAEAKGRNAS